MYPLACRFIAKGFCLYESEGQQRVQLRHCYDLFNYGALVARAFTFELHKFNKSSTLLLIVVEGYSTTVGKRSDSNVAEEEARRSPTGSLALRESKASATKRPAGTEITPTLWK